jgi:hypothetical protein
MHGITHFVAHFAGLNARHKIGQIIKVCQNCPSLLRQNGDQETHMDENALAIIMNFDIDLMALTMIRMIGLD